MNLRVTLSSVVLTVAIVVPCVSADSQTYSPYTELASMPAPRDYMEAYSFGGYIYSFVGVSGNSPSLVQYAVYRYDVANDLWETVDSTTFTGWAMYSALIGDDVYFAGGGIVAGWFKDSVFRYNIPTGQIDTLPNLPEPLISGHAFNDNGKFHLLGGHNGYHPYNANYVFDPATNVWSSEPFLPAGLQSYSLAQFDTLVYMIGGRGLGGFPSSNINLVYNSNSHSFSYKSPMPAHRLDAAYAILNGEVYVFGGRRGNYPPMDTVQIYNPVTDSWRQGPPLPFPNKQVRAVTFGQSIYLMGGWDGTNVIDRVFRYSPFAAGSIVIEPDTMYAFQLYSIEPIVASIYAGDFGDGRVAGDINSSTVSINHSISPTFWEIEPSHPDFTGEVIRFDFILEGFLQAYMPLWNTSSQTFTLSGQFTDGNEFNFEDSVVMVGHSSGDFNLDGSVDIVDLTMMVDFMFQAGPAPVDPETADMDHSGIVDIVDLSLLVDMVFG